MVVMTHRTIALAALLLSCLACEPAASTVASATATASAVAPVPTATASAEAKPKRKRKALSDCKKTPTVEFENEHLEKVVRRQLRKPKGAIRHSELTRIKLGFL